MKNNINVIEKAQIDRLNERLKAFGYTVGGGSYDWDNKTWSIGINAGYNPHYSRDEVAEALMQTLGEGRIILDGRLFTLQELRDREKRVRRLRRERMKEALA
ncbi:MAG: hypothetical protein HFJ28_03785 [Clostridia bacterium]|jgi:hypothetical protein|nr:hypothetical protein [Clostridia bacterium]